MRTGKAREVITNISTVARTLYFVPFFFGWLALNLTQLIEHACTIAPLLSPDLLAFRNISSLVRRKVRNLPLFCMGIAFAPYPLALFLLFSVEG